MSRPVVVKVGGSLLDWTELPARLASYLASRSRDRLVLVVGGGRTTDVVRALDRVHGLGEERSHAIAMHSLDLTAHLLAALVNGLVVADRLHTLSTTWEAGKIPVAAPRRIVAEIEARSGRGLPHSWEVTSDSIAAFLAAHLECRELVLMKSAPLPPGADRHEAARLGLVDPFFVEASGDIARVDYLDLRATPLGAGPSSF